MVKNPLSKESGFYRTSPFEKWASRWRWLIIKISLGYHSIDRVNMHAIPSKSYYAISHSLRFTMMLAELNR